MHEVGDVVTLAGPRMRPAYLNGTRVKITGHGRRGIEGEIVEMLTPRSGGRFRVGGQIIFHTHHIEKGVAA